MPGSSEKNQMRNFWVSINIFFLNSPICKCRCELLHVTLWWYRVKILSPWESDFCPIRGPVWNKVTKNDEISKS